jgi:hypothetical protein
LTWTICVAEGTVAKNSWFQPTPLGSKSVL